MKLFLFTLILLISIQLTSKELITLRGNPIQGGVLICDTNDSVEKLFLDHKEILIFENKAILGFDRDEKLKHIITIALNDGKMYSSNFLYCKNVIIKFKG